MAKPEGWEDVNLYRVAGRRRAIGAALIMVVVVILLPMMLNHSQSPKLKEEMASVSSSSKAPALPPATPLPTEGANADNVLQDKVVSAPTIATNQSLAPTNLSLGQVNKVNSPNDKPSITDAKPVASVTTPAKAVEGGASPATQQSTLPPNATSSSTASNTNAPISGSATAESHSAASTPVALPKEKANEVKDEKVLQCGLFADESRAKGLVKELKHHGIQRVHYEKMTSLHPVRYRVYVGPFASTEKLHEIKKQLADLGYKTLVKDHH